MNICAWMQAGREIQGISGHKGEDPEEHRGEEGTPEQPAARTQRHHAGKSTAWVAYYI